MIKTSLFAICISLLLTSCAAMLNDKVVTIVGDGSRQYSGVIKYRDSYSGILTVSEGPGGESFSGNFVVVDQTSVATRQGSIVVPQNNQIPAVGGVTQTSSGEINATGYWYGVGNMGTTIDGTMTIGIGGHGYGVCKDSKGNSYKIIF